jgi:SAM-dependent methyltransferase
MRGAYAHDSYFEGGGVGYSSYLAQEGTLRLTFRRFLREMSGRAMAQGRLLEVGCAYGFFLAEAARYFSRRVGTDYSPAAVEMARTNADRVVLGGLEALGEEEAFDCAAVIHVIEHIYHPRAFLTELLTHVRPGGWVVFATPDMGSFWRPLQRYRWPFFKVPEHVTFFDRASLRALLESAGCVEVQTLPYVSVFSLAMIGEKLGWRPPAFLERLRFWLPGTTIAAAGRRPG